MRTLTEAWRLGSGPGLARGRWGALSGEGDAAEKR